MQDEKNELPEGTDKIIVGASTATTSMGGGDTGGDTGGASAVNEDTDVLVVDIDERGSESAAPTGLSAGTGPTPDEPVSSGAPGGGKVIGKIRSGGEKLSGKAADKARGLVGQGLERGAEALANVGRMVGDTADGIEERLGAEYGEYARRAAGAIEDAANNLASKDPDELIDDTRNFVRKSPGVALAGAAVVGFALARLIKAGLDRGSNGNSPEDPRAGGSSEA
jgi:hypothetical protein